MTAPPFSPSGSVVGTNVLWFASLTLSLISASLGILVKQWLRHYLAGDYSSPQARLRVRHIRYPTLSSWKVFEFAAAIPVLLQVSLALFFVGLCLFSAHIDNSIGYTTLPLVAGWAYLILILTFAPLFSPRCPYKTTFLVLPMRFLRKYLANIASPFPPSQPPTHKHDDSNSESLCVEKPQRLSDDSSPSPATERARPADPYDETAVANDGSQDIDILLAIDATQSGDERLLRVMCDALDQSTSEPAEVTDFLLRIVGSRVELDLTHCRTRGPLNLKHLSRQTSITITDMVCTLLLREMQELQGHSLAELKIDSTRMWMQDCVYLLFAEWPCPLSESANASLTTCLAGDLHAIIFEVMDRVFEKPIPVEVVLQKLQGVLVKMSFEMTTVIYDVLQRRYCVQHMNSHTDLLNLCQAHPDIPTAIWRAIFDLAVKNVTTTAYLHLQWQAGWQDELFKMMLQLAAETQLAELANEVIRLTRVVLCHFAVNYTVVWWLPAIGMNYSGCTGRMKEIAQAHFIEAIVESSSASKSSSCFDDT